MPVYTIQNNELRVSVNSRGAELCSLKHGLKEELIWQGNIKTWARQAPVLFPVVGKLKNNTYSYRNILHSLPQHGFARDSEFILTEQSHSVLEFELTAGEESLKIYPFHFSLSIRYELSANKLSTTYKIFNPDNDVLLFSIGAHPGFSCQRKQGESLSDCYLEFETENELVCEELNGGLLTGNNYKIKLVNRILRLDPALFSNDALVFMNSQINGLILGSEKLRLKIKLTCNGWPYFGIWAKKGSDEFVCLEPWHGVADNVNTAGILNEKEGIVCLEPHQTFSSQFNIEIID